MALASGGGAERGDTTEATSSQHSDFDFQTAFFTKRNQGSLEKELLPGPGKENYRMSLEYLIVPECKEVLKKKMMGTCPKDKGSKLKELPMAESGTI